MESYVSVMTDWILDDTLIQSVIKRSDLFCRILVIGVWTLMAEKEVEGIIVRRLTIFNGIHYVHAILEYPFNYILHFLINYNFKMDFS